MGDRSRIEWTDATWNPVGGCSRVSEGCRHCYAERLAARFSAPGQPYDGLATMRGGEPRWTGAVRLIEKHLEDPLRWRRPRRIFVNSMSDLFHELLPVRAIARVFDVMAAAEHHTFQVLTKRPERMLRVLTEELPFDVGECWPGYSALALAFEGRRWPLPNVWLGVSAENQPTADERIPLLLQTPAAVRFLSAEPLIDRIDLHLALASGAEAIRRAGGGPIGALDWVIAGGESGPGARPMHPAWARRLRDQCRTAGVAFFFKQWGEWAPVTAVYDGDEDAIEAVGGFDMVAVDLDGHAWVNNDHRCDGQPPPGSWYMTIRGKASAGRLLDGRTWNEIPGTQEELAL